MTTNRCKPSLHTPVVAVAGEKAVAVAEEKAAVAAVEVNTAAEVAEEEVAAEEVNTGAEAAAVAAQPITMPVAATVAGLAPMAVVWVAAATPVGMAMGLARAQELPLRLAVTSVTLGLARRLRPGVVRQPRRGARVPLALGAIVPVDKARPPREERAARTRASARSWPKGVAAPSRMDRSPAHWVH